MHLFRTRLFLLLVLLVLLPMAACTKIVTITAPSRDYTFGPECDMFGTSRDGTSSLHDWYANCPAPGGFTEWLDPSSGIKWTVVWTKHYTDGKP